MKGGSGVCGGGGGGEFNAFVFNDSDFTGSWSWFILLLMYSKVSSLLLLVDFVNLCSK